MSPDQRAMARQRFQQWRQLTPQQRQTLRRRWQQFRSLPPQQQQAIRRSYREFQRLPPGQRSLLRHQWQSATPAQRQLMIQHANQMRSQRQMMPMPRFRMGVPSRRPPR
jgi:hypothetical protein